MESILEKAFSSANKARLEVSEIHEQHLDSKERIARQMERAREAHAQATEMYQEAQQLQAWLVSLNQT